MTRTCARIEVGGSTLISLRGIKRGASRFCYSVPMRRRFQFSLGRLMGVVAILALTALSVTKLAQYDRLASDPAVMLLWLAFAVSSMGAAIGSVLDRSAPRGALIGAAFGLVIVMLLLLPTCNQIRE